MKVQKFEHNPTRQTNQDGPNDPVYFGHMIMEPRPTVGLANFDS